MSTYVFFCGYGTWYSSEDRQEYDDGLFFCTPFEQGYAIGYFMIGKYDELEHKHLGKLPTSLYPCDDTNIKHCAFNRLNKNSQQYYQDKKESVYFSIDDDREYSLAVVEKKDIQMTENEPLNSTLPDKNYISKDLKILNRAALEFWSTVDEDNKATHPANDAVIDWLKKKGFSYVSAKQGAVIIRPDWAHTGRPPKKEV
jgi:hypothetical protein